MGQERNQHRFSGRRARRVIPALAVAAGAILWSTGAGATSAGATMTGPHGLHTKGASNGASSTSNLVDNGGRITPASNTYAIFWGPQSAWPADVFGGISTLLGDLNGSNYLGIAQQYMRNTPISSAFKGEKLDSSAPPRKVSPSTLGAEVAKFYGSSLDPSGIYFVYTSNFPNGGGFCAWHSFTSVSGQKVAVAYMPNTNGVAGCNGGNQYGDSRSEGLYSLANVTAHEFMEAVTDTWPANGSYGWIDSSGSEIGDKCAWQFSGSVNFADGSHWQLQKEWDNSIVGCNQGS